MSKHALSRIYEKYVMLLRPESEGEQEQFGFFGTVPTAVMPKKTGTVYTPQFIAGFFGRFIRENTTPKTFRDMRFVDPACGSGLFLRTILELQCDPFGPGVTRASIERAFSLVEGIDRDPNACEATRLSLALLHLIATGILPRSADLKIRNQDAISAILREQLRLASFGAVITNPPYIKLDHLPQADRQLYNEYLGRTSGRVDAYIPFTKLCLDLVKPAGFVCLVLPQTFLTAGNAAELRKRICRDFDILCLVDLSAVSVFEGLGAYTVLLIVQKREHQEVKPRPVAQVAQVTERVGAALQACLDGNPASGPFYNVFPVAQSYFDAKNWIIVSPEQIGIDERLHSLPTLSGFMEVRQGLVTGADDVFIRLKSLVPKGERAIYADFLSDRQIGRYRLPRSTDEVVFYPYENDQLLGETELASRYPETWDYLCANRKKLAERKSVIAGDFPWWRPERPREPSNLLRPKIVCPHLMLTPRFAVDAKGKFAISRAPYVMAKDKGEEKLLLEFFSAVLNSTVCNWYLRTYAPKYRSGYNRLEVNLLKSVPVPDLSTLSAGELATVCDLVRQLSQADDVVLDDRLDGLITGFYGFAPSERRQYFGLD